MKKLLLAFFLFAVAGFSQAIRFDSQALTTNPQCQTGSLCPVLAVPGAVASFYTSATLTTPATTYTSVSASAPCPAYAQVTLPGSLQCTTASDNSGNFGVWIGAGTWYYTLTYPAAAGGGTKGPYAFTAGASGILAAGSDTMVQYNKAGQFGASNALIFNYTVGNLYITASQPNVTGLSVDTNGNALSGISFYTQGLSKWALFSNPTSGNVFVLYDEVSASTVFDIPSGPGSPIEFRPNSGNVNFYGNPGTPAISTVGGAYVYSTGGFLSNVGSWQAFNSASDGALLRGYGLAPNAANNAGGYIDIAPTTYNPNGGGSCTDANGNPVQQPSPLPGLSGFGTHDTIMWVTQSPQMPPNGSCGSILPINEDWGLAITSYLFARGGLATDNASFNAINAVYLSGGVPSGGVEANTIIAGTLYPAGTTTTTGTLLTATYLGGHIIIGTSLGPPAAGTIATVTNPFSVGEGLKEGMMYGELSTHTPWYYNGSTWINIAGGGGGSGCTPGGIHLSIQINNGSGGCTGDANFIYNSGTAVTLTAASFIAAGTSAGFDATTCNLTNCIQAPSGGILGLTLRTTDSVIWVAEAAPALSASGQAREYFDSGSNTLQCSLNGGAYGNCAGSGGGGGSPGSPTNSVQVNNGSGGFAGSANLIYASSILTLTSGTYVATGTSAGFNANTCTLTNCIEAPLGGVLGLTLRTTDSVIWVAESAPSLSASNQARMYFDSGTFTLNCSYNGSAYTNCSGAGGSGTVSAGAINQVGVYTGTTTIGGFAGFTWNNSTTTLTVTGTGIITTGAFNTSATGSSIAFQGGGGSFQVNGAGTISGIKLNINGGTTTGITVSADGDFNSIASVGGINLCSANTCSGAAMSVNGVTVLTQAQVATFSGLTVNGVTSTSGAIFTSVGLNVLTCTLTNCIQTIGGIQANGVNGAIAVTTNQAANSIQTTGGFNACTASGCLSGIAFEVAGTKLIDSSRNAFVNNITISGTCTGCSSAAVASITGTTNQVLANGTSGSAQTGAVTLTLPQSIGPGSTPTFNGMTLAGGLAANGGIITGSSTNSTIYIGTSGNFYNRPLGGSSAGVSCSGIADGWSAISSDDYVVVCLGGSRFRAALASY